MQNRLRLVWRNPPTMQVASVAVHFTLPGMRACLPVTASDLLEVGAFPTVGQVDLRVASADLLVVSAGLLVVSAAPAGGVGGARW